MDASKYSIGYYPAPGTHLNWARRDHIEKAPLWCSVDLRDGNQSLVIPMSLEQKLKFYQMLLRVGFKEIEVGFPAASETEYEFLRTLIERDMIPKDVTVQVLTQCREHIIRKTFEACKGAPNAIIHFYNSTSVAQREQVFRKSKEEIKKIAVDGAKLVKKLAAESERQANCKHRPQRSGCLQEPLQRGLHRTKQAIRIKKIPAAVSRQTQLRQHKQIDLCRVRLLHACKNLLCIIKNIRDRHVNCPGCDLDKSVFHGTSLSGWRFLKKL